MPIIPDQTLLQPTVYGNSFAKAPSVALAKSAAWITPASIAPDRPGTVAGGLSMADLMTLSTAGNLTDFSKVLKPISIPTTTFGISGSSENTGAVRTGSLELNMLDMTASAQMATGSFIGRRTPLIAEGGTLAPQGPMETALGWMSDYGTMPTKLMDYAAAIPGQILGWNNAQSYMSVPNNPDGSPVQPFQKLSDYWYALRVIQQGDEAKIGPSLDALATQIANSTVGPGMVPALKAQLLSIFNGDLRSLTGLSSGSERTDWLAKMNLQNMLDIRDLTGSNDPFGPGGFSLLSLVGAAGYVAGNVGRTLVSALPFVGPAMGQFISPVRADTEAAWARLTPQNRLDFFGNAQIEGAAADFVVAIPLFSGLGAAIGLARAGAAGQAVDTAATSGNALLRMVQHTAWLAGRPAVAVPAILTKEGAVGRVIASVFGNALPETGIHLTNVYDFALHTMKLTMAAGVEVWAINSGLSLVSPAYAAGMGKIIDSSHYVTDSAAAGALDMLGLFAGETMGASTMLRVNRAVAGKALSVAGIEWSPVNSALSTHYGTVSPRLLGYLKVGGKPMAFAIPHLVSTIQRYVQDTSIALAERARGLGNEALATEIMGKAKISESAAMDMFARLQKAANEKFTGLETDAARADRASLKKYAQSQIDAISMMMERENGYSYWSGRLGAMKDEAGKTLAANPAGYREFIRQTLNLLGHDGEASVKMLDRSPEVLSGLTQRGRLDPWKQAANGTRQYAFNILNGSLKEIVKEGVSTEAPLLFVQRANQLYKEVAGHFIALFDAGDKAGMEQLQTKIVRTPLVLEWWSKSKGSSGGARTPDEITSKDLYDFLKQMQDHLPGKRVTPGPNSVDGSLNDLQLLAEKMDYTLSFKPTETTTAGLLREQVAAAEREIAAYEANLVALDVAESAAYNAWSSKTTIKTAELDATMRDPAKRKSDAAWAEARKFLQEYEAFIGKDRGGAPMTPRELIHLGAMDKRLPVLEARATRLHGAHLAADKKAWEMLLKDPELVALKTATDLAVSQADVAKAMPAPRAYKVGPVAPTGYTPDLQAAIAEALATSMTNVRPGGNRALQSAVSGQAQRDIEAARVIDPHAGEALYHVTTAWAKVLEGGLLGRDDLVALNLATGMGGGNIVNGVSLSWNWAQAEMNARQMEGARAAANGEMSMEEVLAHYRNLHKMLNDRGKAIYARLRDEPDGNHYDPNARNAPALTANGNVILDAAEYRQWLKDELVKPENYNIHYENADTVVDRLGEWPDFTDRWLDWQSKHSPSTPTDAEKWQGILDILNDPAFDPGPTWRSGKPYVNKAFATFVVLDQELPPQPGGKTYILGDGSNFVGKVAGDFGIVRVSVNPRAFLEAGHAQFSGDPGEIRINADDLFVHKALPDQFDDPLGNPLTLQSDLGPSTTPVSYVAVRNATSGEVVYLKTPFLDYPLNKEWVDLGNQNFLASKIDGALRGIKTWRLTDYMKGQTHRLFTTNYDVLPEQVDAYLARVMSMAYEKWSVGGFKYGQVPLGFQAVALLRSDDVLNAAMESFGKIKNEATGKFEPAPIRSRITGKMEVPDYTKLTVDGFRQAWTMNFTSALTSRFYSLGSMGPSATSGPGSAIGFGAILGSQWVIPNLRYQLSPIFKASETAESAAINFARGTKGATEAQLATHSELGGSTQIGQLATEIGSGDLMAQGLMGGLPTVEEALRLYPHGLADITNDGTGFGFVKAWNDLAAKRAADAKIKGALHDAWEMVWNPTPFKDRMSADLVVQLLGKDFGRVFRQTEPTAFAFYSKTLKVPEDKLADFVAMDRALYQGFQDGTVTWAKFIDHHATYNKTLKEPTSVEMDAFYNSEEWQATAAMFRIGAKAAQTEAFGVHYFGSYRSPLERGINHPLLGSYPASWAYKAAKEWFKFLFDNRTFGNGELRLGATPAAYLQSLTNAQAIAYARGNTDSRYASLDDWMRHGPYAQGFFMLNLLMPGDWSNIPFPMSRSIRMVLRGNINPIDHISQNLFGPNPGVQPGGIGVIRDWSYATTGIQNIMDEITGRDQTPFQKLNVGLNSDGTRQAPADFNAVTQYPTTIDLTPLNEAPQR